MVNSSQFFFAEPEGIRAQLIVWLWLFQANHSVNNIGSQPVT